MAATLSYSHDVHSQAAPSSTRHRPSTLPAPPSGVRMVSSGFSRSRSTIERRTPVLRSGPASFGELPYGVVPDPRDVQPFDHAPEQVPARTRAVTECMCAGQADCDACAGTGYVATWVEIESHRSQRVHVSGEGAARDHHPGIYEAEDFERGEWDNQLVHQAWFRGVPDHLAADLQPELAPNERVLWLLVQTFVG